MKKDNDSGVQVISYECQCNKIDNLLKTNAIVQQNLQKIKDSYSAIKKLKKIDNKLFRETWCVANKKCQEQLQKFYDCLIGNDLNNFGKVLLTIFRTGIK